MEWLVILAFVWFMGAMAYAVYKAVKGTGDDK
jgi:hypothetical protein